MLNTTFPTEETILPCSSNPLAQDTSSNIPLEEIRPASLDDWPDPPPPLTSSDEELFNVSTLRLPCSKRKKVHSS